MELNFKDGVKLKSRALKRVLQRKGYTQSKVVQSLGMSKRTFMSKLYLRQNFNQKEITALIKLVGARAAIKVIWFPSLEEKKRIEKYVWEEQM